MQGSQSLGGGALARLGPGASRALAGGVCAVAAVGVAAAHRQTLAVMAEQWWSQETYSHGMLVLPVCAWLLWRNRDSLAPIPIAPAPSAIIPMLGLACAWLVAALASVNAPAQFAVVAMCALQVALIMGWPAARANAFPLGFALFAVPFGDFLVPAMISHTADVTVWALSVTGIPVYREGDSFIIPSGRWSVVDACSGLRYLIASVCVGSLFAYLNYRSAVRRAAFVALSIVVPIVANWVRAYLIVILGHVSGMRVAAGADHLIYGWIFFGLVMAALFAIGARWREPAAASDCSPARCRKGRADTPPARLLAATLAGLLVCIAPTAIEARLRAIEAPGMDLDRLADRLGELRVARPPQAWMPAYSGARAERRLAVPTRGSRTDVYLGDFANQRESSELIRHGNTVAGSDGHNGVTLSRATVPAVDGLPEREEWLLRLPAGDRLVWRWFSVGSRTLSDERAVKLATAWQMLKGEGDANLVVVVSTEVQADGIEKARRRLAGPARALASGGSPATTRAPQGG